MMMLSQFEVVYCYDYVGLYVNVHDWQPLLSRPRTAESAPNKGPERTPLAKQRPSRVNVKEKGP